MSTTICLIHHTQSLQSEYAHYSQWPMSPTGKIQAIKLLELLDPFITSDGKELFLESDFQLSGIEEIFSEHEATYVNIE